jgi:hypothetical protein
LSAYLLQPLYHTHILAKIGYSFIKGKTLLKRKKGNSSNIQSEAERKGKVTHEEELYTLF